MPKRSSKWLVGVGLTKRKVGRKVHILQPQVGLSALPVNVFSQPASRVEAIVRISRLSSPEDQFTFCALQISMPKARESHLKDQTAFSFHMQKRDEKCKLQTTALRWGTHTESKKNQTNQKCHFLSNFSFAILLFSIFHKIVLKAENNSQRASGSTAPSWAHLPGKPLSSCAAESPSLQRLK